MNVNGQQYVVLTGASVTQRLDGSYSSRLDLYNLAETDTGTYLCLATNSVGFNLLSTHIIVLAGRGAETVDKKLIDKFNSHDDTRDRKCVYIKVYNMQK